VSRWSNRPAPDAPDGLILFDGVCLLCSGWVKFVIERDREMRFRFLPIQSDAGRRFAEQMGVCPDAPQTNVVIHDGRAWFKSDAARGHARVRLWAGCGRAGRPRRLAPDR